MEYCGVNECDNCGAILGHNGGFCDEYCEREYQYINRTCGTCGGEFWDGGTTCDCEDWDDDEDMTLLPDWSDDEETDDLPF